jgi:hypothetical protein
MSVDTPRYRFHNSKEADIPLTPRKTSLEQALEEAVSRALRDNLAPLQRTADELHHAYADLVAACGSSRPSNALPALLRAQTAAAALAAGLSVLSNFVAVALNPREQQSSEEREFAGATSTVGVEAPDEAPEDAAERQAGPESARGTAVVEEPAAAQAPPEAELEWVEEPEEALNAAAGRASVPSAAPPPEEDVAEEAFDLANLPREEQELHRRANRVAKVAMQDIKLLHPKEVHLGREHKDICVRLRADIDKARKEYDRRFRAIKTIRWIISTIGWWRSSRMAMPRPSANIRIPRLFCGSKINQDEILRACKARSRSSIRLFGRGMLRDCRLPAARLARPDARASFQSREEARCFFRLRAGTLRSRHQTARAIDARAETKKS